MGRKKEEESRWEERGRCLRSSSARAALFGFLHRGCQDRDQFIRFCQKTAQVGVPWVNAGSLDDPDGKPGLAKFAEDQLELVGEVAMCGPSLAFRVV